MGQVQFTWKVQTYYSGLGCTGEPIYVNTFRSTLACSPTSCQSGTGGSHSYRQTCGARCSGASNCVGTVPTGTAELQAWNGESCGAGVGAELTAVLVSQTDLCLDVFEGSGSFRLRCNSGRTAVTREIFNARSCQGGSSPSSSISNIGCSIPFSAVSRQATCRVPSPPPLSCSNRGSVLALSAQDLPSGNNGE